MVRKYVTATNERNGLIAESNDLSLLEERVVNAVTPVIKKASLFGLYVMSFPVSVLTRLGLHEGGNYSDEIPGYNSTDTSEERFAALRDLETTEGDRPNQYVDGLVDIALLDGDADVRKLARAMIAEDVGRIMPGYKTFEGILNISRILSGSRKKANMISDIKYKPSDKSKWRMSSIFYAIKGVVEDGVVIPEALLTDLETISIVDDEEEIRNLARSAIVSYESRGDFQNVYVELDRYGRTTESCLFYKPGDGFGILGNNLRYLSGRINFTPELIEKLESIRNSSIPDNFEAYINRGLRNLRESGIFSIYVDIKEHYR